MEIINGDYQVEQKRDGTVSLLQGDEQFCSRILSKDSSKGFSSRVYYRNAGVVPFEWEAQPGKPKNLPEHESIPSLTPPPAVLSSSFARPCIPPTKASIPARIWKKIRTSLLGMKNQTELVKEDAYATNNGSEYIEEIEFWSSDHRNSFSSPPAGNSGCLSHSSSLSSSSSSFNSCNGSPLTSSKTPLAVSTKEETEDFDGSRRFEGPDWALGCTPWNVPQVLVRIASRRK